MPTGNCSQLTRTRLADDVITYSSRFKGYLPRHSMLDRFSPCQAEVAPSPTASACCCAGQNKVQSSPARSIKNEI
ncbi:hypothetical protein PAHAL_8G048900 [Panicum hallii]|uniref:Uncharacterized protein n=1 Tax=Panicum hallii TaxID=206008 RepID=A0A2S3ICZ9_9POAL|nr:hypothetical protein PAHAL_8G048900 [Panicum hallii]